MVRAFEKNTLKLLISIVDIDNSKTVKEILKLRHLHLHFSFRGKGTATSEILDILGLGGTDKYISFCLAPESQMVFLLNSLRDNLKLEKAGTGIAFVLPLSGLCFPDKNRLGEQIVASLKERWNQKMEMSADAAMNAAVNDLIMIIVNHGYSDEVVDTAKAAGARGGTVIHARGADIETPVKFFELSIQPEKEVIMILVRRDTKQKILDAINIYCGKDKDAKGIVFTMPVEEILGIPSLE